ncbi:MAG TPA: hypothetical protein VGI80_01865 [Pyrinomonadaceae bacterium]|jgi:biopolymer transport protein ExbD
MKLNKALIAIAMLSFACTASLAQRRPAAVTVKVASPPDYQFHLRIGDDGKLFVSMVSETRGDAITPEDLTALVTDLPSGAGKVNEPSGAFPIVVIEPSRKITMLDLWNPITLFPRGRTKITLVLPTEGSALSVSVPWHDPNASSLKPNPLTLIVKMEDNGSITLNNEPEGTIANIRSLIDRLKEVFTARRDSGVFRENSNEVETTIMILMPMSDRKVSDLIAIAKAVRDAGSDRIGLIMDEPKDIVITERKEILSVPTSPPPKKRP